MKEQTLEKAVEDFNKWKGTAIICYDTEEKVFCAEVFASGSDRDNAWGLSSEMEVVLQKGERGPNYIAKKQNKEQMLKIAELLDEGYRIEQAKYKVLGPGAFSF